MTNEIINVKLKESKKILVFVKERIIRKANIKIEKDKLFIFIEEELVFYSEIDNIDYLFVTYETFEDEVITVSNSRTIKEIL